MKHVIFELAAIAAKKEDSNLAEVVQSLVSLLTNIKDYPESWHDISYISIHAPREGCDLSRQYQS
jgi:hypothetical protein